MTSALLKDIRRVVSVGATSYAFCRAFNQHNAFEKAVLATVLVGLGKLAEAGIKGLRGYEYQLRPPTHVLIGSSSLLAIPFALYAGRIFNFKTADYLQIVGLTTLGSTITNVVENLGKMIFQKRKEV